MHEISLVRTIFRTIEEEFTTEELDRVRNIRLKIGPLANVDAILLKNAFDAVVEQEETRFQKVQLQINEIPILIACTACGAVTEVINYSFVCTCGLASANIVQGNELLIEHVEFFETV
ncbi:MAG: hydrogenase maturation nickel metallochaperone HypA [Saprospiraceae bacterium]|nr:hydrogenase maturation nickel metallochaperone HypA [Saprospiraceae bacterium]